MQRTKQFQSVFTLYFTMFFLCTCQHFRALLTTEHPETSQNVGGRFRMSRIMFQVLHPLQFLIQFHPWMRLQKWVTVKYQFIKNSVPIQGCPCLKVHWSKWTSKLYKTAEKTRTNTYYAACLLPFSSTLNDAQGCLFFGKVCWVWNKA